jgi:MFS transporter, PPP family, 3-phenylpropionic acid transporter
MWFLEPWRRAMGPVKVLILAGLASAVRWTALAFSPPLWLLFPVQALHALSFGATFLAALQLTDRLSSRENASAAQAVNSAFSGGLLAGAATIASGWMFDRGGALGYLVMTAMCLLGLAGALWLATLKRPNL